MSLERQSEILQEGFAQARAWPWVGAMFVYALRDGANTSNWEDQLGLLRYKAR